ncbi:hypothetical protein HOH15_07970 [Candidatus Woesearchaeota archaeon]|nr:hypothetical protein [Candidatus Woesearchaeota archaeon]
MKKKVIFCIIIISLLFLAACAITEDLAGEAKKTITKTEKGTWLVVVLKNNNAQYEIIKTYTQEYNKEKFDVFERLLPNPKQMNHDSTIYVKQLVNRQEIIITETFESKTALISEKFNKDNTIDLIDYNIQDHKILELKIPIDNKINPSKPIEIKIKTPRKEQYLIKKEDFLRWKKLFQQEIKKKLSQNRPNKRNNLITGRTITEENICSHLKQFQSKPSLHTNKPYDPDRINLVFIGFNHQSIDQVTDAIPYLLDLEGEGIESYYIDAETGGKKEVGKARGIFYFSPLKSNKNKFNFWYIDEIQEAYKLYNEFSNPCKCRDPNVNYAEMLNKCGLNNVKVSVLCNDICVSKASYNGGHLELSTKHSTQKEFFTQNDEKLPLYPGEMQVISHEFGHLFGGLADEYTISTNVDTPRFPNCLPDKEVAKELLLDIFPNLEYHYGCSYSKDNVRFSESSLMSWAFTGDSFNDVSKFYICYQIFSKFGDVDGEFCDSIFFKEFEKPLEICGDGIDNNGNGKTDCQEYVCRVKDCNEFINEYQIQEWVYNQVVSTSEDFEKYCNDGIDNDFNKKIDCEDNVCFSETCYEVCNDGQDNNLNGLFDCDDPSCKGTLICDEICGDGIDNNNNQIIDFDSIEYKKCASKKVEFMNNCSLVQLFDKECTDKAGMGEACTTNQDCFWQSSFIEGDSCIDGLCKAHSDIYAISPPPKMCKTNSECNEGEKCKEVAYAGAFKSPNCMKNVINSFNKCVECLDPDCKYTDVCS